MSSSSIIHRSLVAAFVLSIAGVAFARQPPALLKAQRAAERAAVCDGQKVRPGAGYRDVIVRFGLPAQARSSTQMAKGAGYRDSLRRFGVGPAASEVACNPAPAPRTTARL
jgi:hypothetical protein